MIVWISGPTGSGKTSMATLLRELGYAVVQETLPQDLFRKFSQDPSAHCERLQREIMLSRFDGWRRVSQSSRIAFDRTVDEDVAVFCKMHQDAGFLTGDQYMLLKAFGRELGDAMPKPDLILFMSAVPAALRDRMENTATPTLIVDNLTRQLALYAEWLTTRDEPVLRMDNSQCTFRAVQRLLMEA